MASEEIHDNPTGWVNKDVRRYVESGGAKGTRLYGHNALLLTTRGARSGKLRRTALWYVEDGDRYLLTGSNGAARSDPAWVFNVRANPGVVVQVRSDTFAAVAHVATPEERPPLWESVSTAIPQYAAYQKRVRRELPVVVVERA
jgi:deazaflavin-dependent oxidoreductase (nitroreductase family)